MYRLLVVNGDPDAGPALSTLFEDNGFRVLLADTFELGIRRAETYRPGRPGSRGRAAERSFWSAQCEPLSGEHDC